MTSFTRPLTDRDTAALESIDEAISNVYQLSVESAALRTVQDLLNQWKGLPEPTRLQPVALEKFTDSFIVGIAVDRGWNDVLQLIFSYGIPIREADMSKALHLAKERNNINTLKIVLGSSWDINRAVNSHCPPAISLLLDHPDFVEYCLSLGADLNTSSPSGHTTMQRAVAYAPLDTIKLLVQHGASIRETKLLPHAALAYVDIAGKPGIPDRLDVINYLIDRGASIDAQMFHLGIMHSMGR